MNEPSKFKVIFSLCLEFDQPWCLSMFKVDRNLAEFKLFNRYLFVISFAFCLVESSRKIAQLQSVCEVPSTC